MDSKTKKMKHTIKLITIFSIVFTTNLDAQVNLEFNQVVNMFYPYSSANTDGITYDFVVPEGKVLKITSATVYTELSVSSSGQRKYATFAIDGHLLAEFFSDYYTSNASFDRPVLVTNNPFPFWLNAGTHEVRIIQSTNSSNNSSNLWNYDGSRGASVSGIEFNLVED
jgi:hypothetical protein